MKKATIFFWACQDFEKETGYRHKEEVQIEQIYVIAQHIFEKGLNVMLYHQTNSDETFIFVDNKRFTQR